MDYEFESLDGTPPAESRAARYRDPSPLYSYSPPADARFDFPLVARGFIDHIGAARRPGRTAFEFRSPSPVQPMPFYRAPPAFADRYPSTDRQAHTGSSGRMRPASSWAFPQPPQGPSISFPRNVDDLRTQDRRDRDVYAALDKVNPIITPILPNTFSRLWNTHGITLEKSMKHVALRADEQAVEMACMDFPGFMDGLFNDFSPKRHHAYEYLTAQWITAHGLFPANIAGRHVRFDLPLSPEGLPRLGDNALVWRSVYECTGTCLRKTSSGPAAEDGGDSPNAAIFRLASSQWPPSAPALKGPSCHSCTKRLVVEITVGQLATGRITVKYPKQHTPAPIKTLSTSLFLRNQLHQHCLNPGTTAGVLKRVLDAELLKEDSYAYWLHSNFKHRMPDPKQLQNMVRFATTTRHMNGSALAALEIIAERRPECFLSHNFVPVLNQPLPPPVDGMADFDCIMATQFTLEQAIIFCTKWGLFADSSNRKKNAYHCPMTIGVTIDDEHHMIPLVVMVALRQTADQYTHMFREFKKAVDAQADKVLTPGYIPSVDLSLHKRLKEAALRIASSPKGFEPRFIMIDQSKPECDAARRVWPGITVRICQFHLMQGIRRYLKPIIGDKPPSCVLSDRILDAVRVLQRCPAEEQWDQKWELFLADLAEITDGEPYDLSKFPDYLLSSWFKKSWRGMCCDWGMGTMTRDGPWSTNNFCEAAFRTFDRVILCMRVNKRLDMLIHLIIKEYFPLYQNYPPTDPRYDPNLVGTFSLAHTLWRSNLIFPINHSQLPANLRGEFGSRCFVVLHDTDDAVRHFCGFRRSGREWCNCSAFQLGGKRCSHMWAMRTVMTLGTNTQFKRDVSDISSRLPLANNADSGSGELYDYLAEERDFWGRDITQESLEGFTGWKKVHKDRFPPTSEWARARNILGGCGEGIRPKPAARKSAVAASTGANGAGPDVANPDLRGRPAVQERLTGRYYSNKRPAVDELDPASEASSLNPYRPTGTRNTGADCFHTTLSHILVRDPLWVSKFQARMVHPNLQAASSPLRRLYGEMGRFLSDFSLRTVGEYPGMLQVLADNRLTDGTGHAQQDPVELLPRLLAKLDECDDPTTASFSSALHHTATYSMTCEGCSDTFQYKEDSADIFRVRPMTAHANSSTATPTLAPS